MYRQLLTGPDNQLQFVASQQADSTAKVFLISVC